MVGKEFFTHHRNLVAEKFGVRVLLHVRHSQIMVGLAKCVPH